MISRKIHTTSEVVRGYIANVFIVLLIAIFGRLLREKDDE